MSTLTDESWVCVVDMPTFWAIRPKILTKHGEFRIGIWAINWEICFNIYHYLGYFEFFDECLLLLVCCGLFMHFYQHHGFI